MDLCWNCCRFLIRNDLRTVAHALVSGFILNYSTLILLKWIVFVFFNIFKQVKQLAHVECLHEMIIYWTTIMNLTMTGWMKMALMAILYLFSNNEWERKNSILILLISIFSCLIYPIMMMIKMQIQRMMGELFCLSFNWIFYLLFWIMFFFFCSFVVDDDATADTSTSKHSQTKKNIPVYKPTHKHTPIRHRLLTFSV